MPNPNWENVLSTLQRFTHAIRGGQPPPGPASQMAQDEFLAEVFSNPQAQGDALSKLGLYTYPIRATTLGNDAADQGRSAVNPMGLAGGFYEPGMIDRIRINRRAYSDPQEQAIFTQHEGRHRGLDVLAGSSDPVGALASALGDSGRSEERRVDTEELVNRVSDLAYAFGGGRPTRSASWHETEIARSPDDLGSIIELAIRLQEGAQRELRRRFPGMPEQGPVSIDLEESRKARAGNPYMRFE